MCEDDYLKDYTCWHANRHYICVHTNTKCVLLCVREWFDFFILFKTCSLNFINNYHLRQSQNYEIFSVWFYCAFSYIPNNNKELSFFLLPVRTNLMPAPDITCLWQVASSIPSACKRGTAAWFSPSLDQLHIDVWFCFYSQTNLVNNASGFL